MEWIEISFSLFTLVVNFILSESANGVTFSDFLLALKSDHWTFFFLFFYSLVEESLRLWQKRRARADNISAVVVFLDNEFKTWTDTDNESVASSEADTVIISNGEDYTPPMSMGDASSMNTLVRQLALPYHGKMSSSASGDSSSSNSCSAEQKQQQRPESDKLPSPGKLPQDVVTIGTTTHCPTKRKINEDKSTVPPTKQRKSRSVSPPTLSSEESHQSSMITVLSTESLYSLQLDENLAFDDSSASDVNGESGDSSPESDVGLSSGSGGINMEEHLNYIPVPQVAK